jgi:hypothetical protein
MTAIILLMLFVGCNAHTQSLAQSPINNPPVNSEKPSHPAAVRDASAQPTVSPQNEPASKPNQSESENDNQEQIAKFLRDQKFTDWVMAVSTTVIAFYTIRLYVVGKNQEKLMEGQKLIIHSALVDGQRAVLSSPNIRTESFIDPSSNSVAWRFKTCWTNSGRTLAKNVRLNIGTDARIDKLPDDFDFPVRPEPSGSFSLGPNMIGEASDFHVKCEDLMRAKTQEWHFYLWGWARYFDSFPGTAEHVTTFCYDVEFIGDPSKMVGPENPVYIKTHSHGKYNDAN